MILQSSYVLTGLAQMGRMIMPLWVAELLGMDQQCCYATISVWCVALSCFNSKHDDHARLL
jgi:hypothetical protein